MAYLAAIAPLAMPDINFNRITLGVFNLSTASNQVVAGVTYPSALEIDWVDAGVTRASVFYGTGIVASFSNSTLTITAGTVNAYFEGHLSNGQWNLDWGISGISYSAVSLYNAIMSASTTDDYVVRTAILAGNDTIVGSSGGDFISGYGGNDIIDGGDGFDATGYRGATSQYGIVSNNGVVTVADTVAGRDGTDSLHNIEEVFFTDYAICFDLHSSQDTLVYEIYQAAYGRTPDLHGFRYWAQVADAGGLSATTIADQFLAAPEFIQLYGSNPSNSAYVSGLYTHVLGRAPDQGGLNYWVGLADGGMAKDTLLVAFATSPENAALIGSHASATTGYWTTY